MDKEELIKIILNFFENGKDETKTERVSRLTDMTQLHDDCAILLARDHLFGATLINKLRVEDEKYIVDKGKGISGDYSEKRPKNKIKIISNYTIGSKKKVGLGKVVHTISSEFANGDNYLIE